MRFQSASIRGDPGGLLSSQSAGLDLSAYLTSQRGQYRKRRGGGSACAA